jgi:hypothetical protein
VWGQVIVVAILLVPVFQSNDKDNAHPVILLLLIFLYFFVFFFFSGFTALSV